MPLRALALVTHRNSRVCRSETERVQMAWRSSSTRCSPRRMLRAQNLLTPTETVSRTCRPRTGTQVSTICRLAQLLGTASGLALLPRTWSK